MLYSYYKRIKIKYPNWIIWLIEKNAEVYFSVSFVMEKDQKSKRKLKV